MKCHAYVTIAAQAEAKLVVKKSTFLAFAFPAESVEVAENLVKDFKKKYYDARHVCFAYVLTPDGSVFRSSDSGEPSGTAGRPILGAIRSAGLTNVAILVVRYFGGIKLGTPGLTAAYKESAEMAIGRAEKVQHTVETALTLQFPYAQINAVMQLLKRQGVKMLSNEFDAVCTVHLRVSLEKQEALEAQATKIPGVSIIY